MKKISKMEIEKINKHLHYDEITGIFKWKISTGSKKAGSVAGTLNHDGYVNIFLDGKNYRSHRIAWSLFIGDIAHEIDHINGIRHDNRIVNLRDVPHAINQLNRHNKQCGESGKIGVHWYKPYKKWCAKIQYKGKGITIGYFNNLCDAIDARTKKEKQLGFFQKNHIS